MLYDYVLITVQGGHSAEESPAVPVPGDCGRRAEDKLEVGQTVG